MSEHTISTNVGCVSLDSSHNQCESEGANSKVLFLHLILRSYEYNMNVEVLVPANLSLVTLLSSGQCSQL